MLYIQVLGRGLIPRGLGLAPRKEFFKADLNLIQTILMTPGLKVNMRSPEDGKVIAVTRENVKKLWDKYRSDNYQKKTEVKVADIKKDDSVPVAPVVNNAETKPVNPTPVIAPVVEDVKTEVKVESPVISTVKVDEPVEASKTEDNKVDNTAPIKPVMNPEEEKKNNNNNNNQYNNQKNNQNNQNNRK